MPARSSEKLLRELAEASKREVFLKDDLVRKDQDLAREKKKKDAAIAAAQASEGKMKALQRQHELEMKETMDTCRVLRAENDRLREQCQSVSNDAHKSSFDLSRKLGAEHKALMLAKQQAGENTGKSVAELTKQRKATQLAQIERDQVVAAYYSTSEELIEISNGLEMSENENEQIRAEYEQMEETFWEQTQSAQKRVEALAREKAAFQSEMVKARAALETKFSNKMELMSRDTLEARSEKVETGTLLQLTSEEVATTRVELADERVRCQHLDRRNSELQFTVEELEQQVAAEQAKWQASERDAEVLRSKLQYAKEEVEVLQDQRDETELMLREGVDWQKYSAPAFLGQNDRSRRHMQSASPFKNVSPCNAPDELEPPMPTTVLDATTLVEALSPRSRGPLQPSKESVAALGAKYGVAVR